MGQLPAAAPKHETRHQGSSPGMNDPLSMAFVANGLHGFLLVVACLLFLIAAIVAWFIGRTYWATLVAAGLCLATLAMLVSG